MVDLALAIGKGFVRVLHGNPDVKMDIVPVDVVANTHIAAAWSVASGRSTSPLVINCTSGDVTETTLQNYTSTLFDMSEKYPVPKAFQKQSVTIQKYLLPYWLLSFFEHYAPAVVIDALLTITGRKPKLFKLYRFYEKAMDSVGYFLTYEWKFHTENFKNLERQLDHEDKENLYMDLQGFSVKEIAATIPIGAPLYQWEADSKKMTERKRVTHLRYMFTSCIKAVVLGLVLSIMYVLFTSVFRILAVY
ncbi:unnamed protein product [Larinioides sclopetarius]